MFERRLYGHRGASAHLPENTIPAFQRALQDGANAIETDVHITSDGHVVVSHDPDARRTGGVDRRIADCTLTEVQRWPAKIPTLDEVLETFPGVRLNVDIKPESSAAVPPVLEIVARHHAADRVTLTSFHDAVVAEVHARHYQGELGSSQREVIRFFFVPGVFSRWTRPRGNAVQIPPRWKGLRLDTPAFIARCHRHRLRVDYWVINDPQQAKALLAAGADGIVSDDPGAIAPVM